ncbi:immunoglobulin domain-containing protein [Flaviaesturariibacter amylovorans]|uniref:T9SS type A sorting domain-containing protein n=1 Tax=Flaviaesturariibacter amylovorans TaxID=1084520 RepID=A0ABP8G710_9BACT
MRKIYALLAAVLGATSADAQLTGTKNIPGDYATLAAALTDLNTQGVGAGGVIINLTAGNAQTAPAGGFVIGGTGSALLTTASAANTVQIRGNGNTVTASAGHTAGSLTDAVFKLIGADHVALSGFVIQENAGNTVATAASNTMTEWGVALLMASVTDGAQNNRIQNNSISLNRTYLNTFGIYTSARHSATTPGTAAEATAASGSNSNNQVYANNISNVNFGIVMLGSSLAMDDGNDIGGTSAATGNNITNWGGGGTSGFNSLTGNNYCVFLNHQINNNMSWNTIVSASLNQSPTTGGFLQNYSVAAPALGVTTVTNVTNNTVTVTNNASTTTGGTVIGLNVQGINTLRPDATINMNNNTVQGLTLSGSTATSSGMTAIVNLSAAGTVNMNNNTVLNCAITATTATSALLAGVSSSGAAGTVNMNNNTLRGLSSTATSGQIQGVIQSGAVVTAANLNNNKLGDAVGGFFTSTVATSGSLFGIANTGGAATAAVSIQNNDIRGITYNVAASAAQNYIQNAGSTLSQNISGNTFTNLTINSTGAVTFLSNNISTAANGTVTISNNSIVTAFNRTGASGQVTFLNSNSSSPTTVTEVHSGNNFSNITLAGTSSIFGWVAQSGSGTAPFGSVKTITNNTFSNITCGSGSAIILSLGFSSATGNSNMSGNVVSNVTGGGAITGINLSSGTQNLFNNTISGLSGTGTGAVSGMIIASGNTQNVYANKIYNLQNNNAGGAVNGILVTGGINVTLHNNLIGDLRTPAVSAANALNGINITNTAATSFVNVYFNTVYLNATSTGTNFGSSALSANTGPTVDVRNNILANTSTAAGTGLTVAYRRSGTDLATYAGASNNNLFWAGTPSATNLIFHDGTNSDQTLAAFKARVAPRDAASISENVVPYFISTTGTSNNFLHLTAGITTGLESGGVNISGITTDFDGNTRAGNAGYAGTGVAPDIGADEFAGVSVSPSCVAPTTQGTALVFGTASSTAQEASFTAAGGSVTGYLIVRSTGALTGTPVNGTAYSAGNSLGNGVVVGTSATPSFAASGLTANTAYTYTIFTYNSGACNGGPVYNTTAPLAGDATTCAGLPTAVTVTNSGATEFALSWTAPTGGAAGVLSYTLEVATDNAFTNIVSTQTVSTTTATVTGLNANSQYFYRLRASNGVCASANTAVASTSTLCQGPAITGTTPATRCGVGTVTLQAATAAGATLSWYAAATGGSALGTGTSFTTPSLTTTTTFYVQASTQGTAFNVGPVSETTANLASSAGFGQYFRTADAVIINSVEVYPSTAGTLRISLVNASGVVVDFRNFTITAADISNTVKKTLALGFNVPAGSTGWQLAYDIGINRGIGTYTYPYSSNGFSITGNTVDGNNITNGTRNYFWNWNVTQVCNSARTAVIATVNSAPTLSVSATPAAICVGGSTTLTVQSTNAGYTYTWTPGNLSGASVSVSPTATTKYYVNASDNSGGPSNGCAALDSITVQVNVLPAAVTITPSTSTLCTGATATLTASGGQVSGTLINENFNGTAPGWTTENTSTGGTPANAAWRLVASGTSVSSEVFVSNDNSQFALTSSDAQGLGATTRTILNAPVINTTGYSALTLNFYHYHRVYTLALFDSATVEVSTNGTAWTAVRSFKTANTGAFNNFAQATVNLDAYVNQPTLYIRFRYAADWAYNWAIDNVTVTGTQPAAITWSPQAGLFTDAAATTPYTGGAATTVYAKPAAAGMYNYTATSTSGAGCTSSTTLALTVSPATAISTQPAATQSVCAGSAATFTVAATGSALTYQWKKGGADITGATSATYTINAATAADAATYTVVVTGTCGNVTSANAVLNVNAATAITTQPTAAPTVCAGGNVSLTVAATGTGTLTYQWKKNGGNITGANGATLTINNATAADAATYTVDVTGSCGTVTSANAVLTVNAATAITTQPTAQAACAGSAATFTVAASGTGLSYQWRKGGSNITGATSATYTIPSVTAGDAANYDVVITGTCGSVTSNAVALSLTAATSITTQPVGATACEQGATSFTVVASGAGTLSYQWRKGGTNISGATSATLNLSNLTATDAGSYDVVVTGGCGPVTSNAVTLVVNNCTSVPSLDASISSAVLTPNAVRNTTVLRVKATRAARIQWQLVDARGAVVMTFTQTVTAGDNQLRLQLGHLAGGTYLLYGTTDKGKTSVLRAVRL